MWRAQPPVPLSVRFSTHKAGKILASLLFSRPTLMVAEVVTAIFFQQQSQQMSRLRRRLGPLRLSTLVPLPTATNALLSMPLALTSTPPPWLHPLPLPVLSSPLPALLPRAPEAVSHALTSPQTPPMRQDMSTGAGLSCMHLQRVGTPSMRHRGHALPQSPAPSNSRLPQ